MKQLIRNSTFETNSSSIHSLVIFNHKNTYEELVFMLDELDRHRFDITVGEYGWEFEKYDSSLNILSYLWTYVNHCAEHLIEKMKEYMPNTNFVAPSKDSHGFSEGYIDHSGNWELEPIFASKENFAEAVLRSEIATANDNTDIDDYLDYPADHIKAQYIKTN